MTRLKTTKHSKKYVFDGSDEDAKFVFGVFSQVVGADPMTRDESKAKALVDSCNFTKKDGKIFVNFSYRTLDNFNPDDTYIPLGSIKRQSDGRSKFELQQYVNSKPVYSVSNAKAVLGTACLSAGVYNENTGVSLFDNKDIHEIACSVCGKVSKQRKSFNVYKPMYKNDFVTVGNECVPEFTKTKVLDEDTFHAAKDLSDIVAYIAEYEVKDFVISDSINDNIDSTTLYKATKNLINKKRLYVNSLELKEEYNAISNRKISRYDIANRLEKYGFEEEDAEFYPIDIKTTDIDYELDYDSLLDFIKEY